MAASHTRLPFRALQTIANMCAEDALACCAATEPVIHFFRTGDRTWESWDIHPERTEAVCVIDNDTFATVGHSSLISVWRHDEGRVVVLEGHRHFVSHLCLLNSARAWLASASVDGAVRVWSLRSRVCKLATVGPPGRPRLLWAAAPDVVGLVCAQGTTCRVARGEGFERVAAAEPVQREHVLCAMASGLLAVGGADGHIRLIDVCRDGTVVHRLGPLPGAVREMACDGQLLAAADASGKLVIWRIPADAGEAQAVFDRTEPNPWRLLQWSDGRLHATRSAHTIDAIDVETGMRTVSLCDTPYGRDVSFCVVRSVQFEACKPGSVVRVHDLRQSRLGELGDGDVDNAQYLLMHTPSVVAPVGAQSAVLWSSAEHSLAMVDFTPGLRIGGGWPKAVPPVVRLAATQSAITFVEPCFPAYALLAVALRSGALALVSMTTYAPVAVLQASPSPPAGLAVLEDALVAVAHESGTVCVWDVLQRRRAALFKAGAPLSAAAAVRGLLALGTRAGGVELWDAATQTRVAVVLEPRPAPDGTSTLCRLRPTASCGLAAASDDGTWHLWRVGGGASVVQLGTGTVDDWLGGAIAISHQGVALHCSAAQTLVSTDLRKGRRLQSRDLPEDRAFAASDYGDASFAFVAPYSGDLTLLPDAAGLGYAQDVRLPRFDLGLETLIHVRLPSRLVREALVPGGRA